MKCVIIFFLFQAFSFVLIAQATKQGWNNYGTHAELNWADFKGNNPNTDVTAAAEVNTSLEFKWGYQTDETTIHFMYEVFALQNPNASWVDSTQKTTRVLQHEQLHFDITELHARMFRKWLEAFDYTNTRNLRRVLNNKYREVKIAWKRMQQEYDLETNHGILAEEQLNWNQKVQKLLSLYNDYKS